MVRNRRSTVGLSFTRRWARTEHVALSAAERQLYDDVADFVRRGLQHPGGRATFNRMVLITLQLALGSSSQAAAGMLMHMAQRAEEDRKKMGEEPIGDDAADRLYSLADRAERLDHSAKSDRLLKLLDEFPDKLVTFTQFRATQDMLLADLRKSGHEVAVFHGGLSRMDKERAIQHFRGSARVLLTTDAGSEGRNLQFAHGVCNFDLPWNPMKIEQRIGRLSRIGQVHDVHVFNLVAAGTVEAAVLHLLEAKLSMFELVIGEIDMILGNLDEEREFDDVVADLWAQSHDADDFTRRMEDLGNRLLAAKEAYFRQRSHDDRLFGNRFAPNE
jgi:SNF2 family DNA or RNA helicase